MLRLSLLVSILCFGAVPFTVSNALAQEPKPAPEAACEIRHSNVIEIGPPGSGKPQSVHQRWRVSETCEMELVLEQKEFKDPDDSGGLLLSSGCQTAQIEQVMDDIVGQDLTRLDLEQYWCWDTGSTSITYLDWEEANTWAFWDGWEEDGGYQTNYWLSYPYNAEAYAEGYFHFSPTNSFYHTLANAIRVFWTGSFNCYDWHWGSFPSGYDIDIECYSF